MAACLQDLFETIGPLKSTKMTAVGVAEIVFKQAKDATTAFQKYNNVVLDGMTSRLLCD